jgi:hypothetical protein
VTTPARTSIILDIYSTLSNIADIVTVEQFVRPLEDVPNAERPYLAFSVSPDIAEHKPFGSMRWTMPVIVAGWIYEDTDWTTRSAAINNLADAVIGALSADTTRGGYACMTTIKEIMTNESDPDSGGDGYMIMDLEVVYYRSTAAG